MKMEELLRWSLLIGSELEGEDLRIVRKALAEYPIEMGETLRTITEGATFLNAGSAAFRFLSAAKLVLAEAKAVELDKLNAIDCYREAGGEMPSALAAWKTVDFWRAAALAWSRRAKEK